MNRITLLIKDWAASSQPRPVTKEMTIKLTSRDVGRIRALTEMFPSRTQEHIVSDLLATALEEIEAALPYIPGKKVITEDEFGEPVYEDIGMTPKFEALAKKYTL